jgi:hypothetical protein
MMKDEGVKLRVWGLEGSGIIGKSVIIGKYYSNNIAQGTLGNIYI